MTARRKPEKNIKVFISYRNIDLSQRESTALADALINRFGYTVFIDTRELRDRGGFFWEDTIYDNARESDVLIVLLEETTAESEWVQREVDVARGANVSLLPIAIVTKEKIDLDEVQRKLAIRSIQYLPYNSASPNYTPIVNSIERLSKRTCETQKRLYERLQEQRRVLRPTENIKSFARFRMNDMPHMPTLHLAVGDMTEMGNIDVLVNSENNYLQMARVFENRTLSSVLRYKGSHIQDGHLLEDTIQSQLDDYIQNAKLLKRPVPMLQVISTHAGHARSVLVQKGARYIFHVVAMQVSPDRDSVDPVRTNEEVGRCVLNALKKLLQVDKDRGVISLPRCKTYKAELSAAVSYRPIKSIIFPLFGAGHGGRSVSEIAPAMVRGLREFYEENKNTTDLDLKDIYLCVYSVLDIETVRQALDAVFDIVT